MAGKLKKDCIEKTVINALDLNSFLTNTVVLFNALGDAIIVIDCSGNIIQMNNIAENLTKWQQHEVSGKPFCEIISIYNTLTGSKLLEPEQILVKEKSDEWSSEHLTLVNKDDEKKQISCKGTVVENQNGLISGYVFVFRDITEEYKIREHLQASEERFRNLAELLPVGLFESDMSLNLTFVNSEALRMSQYSLKDIQAGMNAMDLLSPESRQKAVAVRKRRLQGETIPVVEYTALRKDGTTYPVLLYINRVSEATGEFNGFRGVIIDISEQKKVEHKLRYLSMHDALTNLYNRTSFEQEMHRLGNTDCLPLGIVVCDIDGLKLINETLGHKVGDELLKNAANILRKSFGKNSFIARIGGDEFAVLLPKTSIEHLEKLSQKVLIETDTHNVLNPDFHVSLSIGFAISTETRPNPIDVFKIADHKMYRAKLHRTRNSRSDIVKSLVKTLETRNILPEGQAVRLQMLATQMAEKIGLSESKKDELILLCRFYDIGKIGVSDSILLKPGPLDTEEYSEVKDHSETGFRIALTISDLIPVADFILKHHEWWNGDGYPLGLKGKEIPSESRILSILDAYDALTNNRPYRKAISHEKALKIIQDNSGIQFDPELVKIFMSIMHNN